jgi:hypothetical protein
LRFTVRRPASAEVSPCCHRPSGGDVACSVHVGVAGPRAARLALENRLALAVFGRDMPTCRAFLRRVRGRDLLDPTGSLVLQSCSEESPTTSADAAVQAAFVCDALARPLHSSPRTARHRTQVEGFDANGVEAARDISCGFFNHVLASGSLTRLELCDGDLHTSSAVGAALGASEPLLKHLQPLGLTAAQAGNVEQFAGRQCRRYDNTTVDTHHAAVTRASDRSRNMGERNMPAARPIAGDPVGLHTLWDRARQAEPHPANLGHPHSAEPTVQPLDMTRFYGHLPESFMYTGFTPLRSAARSAEKAAHRLGEVAQRLLLHRLRASCQPVVLSTGGGQLCTLLVVARRAAAGLPVPLLLDGQVPYISGVATMLRQRRLLKWGRKQSVARHIFNVATTSDKLSKGEAAVPPIAIARRLHAATTI